ncbi:hypothetical protein PCASD_25722 [Puccinia coronata f. sp. avenae]|uniref:Uncharacterized protein n=1 Tax=Puccinia coronata f. sp. avenae TaxID=200324 RepID=A0A2N5SGC9_9BASI|nr:hypothetical protein PCASD_25722 [Puccinia coronata f. sp. avenae]
MKHTPPPTKKTPTGTQGQPPAGSTGTGSTGATSTTSSSATSGTSSTTSTQRPSFKEAAARFAMDDDKLQADGSNFRSWLNEITEFAIMSLDDPTFFNHPQPADAKETVA